MKSIIESIAVFSFGAVSLIAFTYAVFVLPPFIVSIAN